MKTMFMAFAFTIVASFGAYYVMSGMGFSSAEMQSSSSVRLK
jgi:hypothetical protein